MTPNQPHHLKSRRNGHFICDKVCPQFKSYGICNRLIAVAKKEKLLENFLALVRSKRLHFTDLVDADVSKNAASKNNIKHPKKNGQK